MRIYFLGICGTFMAGLAQIARELGYVVAGADTNVYPPMSTQLESQGITLEEGFDPKNLVAFKPDLVVVGNAMKRGNPVVEWILDNPIPFHSGPQWLRETVLKNRWVLAVAGTHGKTTTSTILAWILEYAKFNPGFLIGGIPQNFEVSARLGNSSYFVIEADEYDSAFFDKRPKFIHYYPKTLILNNLEFDHADIYPNVEAIATQFHHLVRTVPQSGRLIVHKEALLEGVLKAGHWSEVEYFGFGTEAWMAKNLQNSGQQFEVYYQQKLIGTVNWNLVGEHNVENALAAIAASHHIGIKPAIALAALENFTGVKRRLEIRGQANGHTVYDDFAHHPTAITKTLTAIKQKVGDAPLVALIELGSYTMRQGHHGTAVFEAARIADVAQFYCAETDIDWKKISGPEFSEVVENNIDTLINHTKIKLKPNSHIVVMSNKGFGGIHDKLLKALTEK